MRRIAWWSTRVRPLAGAGIEIVAGKRAGLKHEFAPSRGRELKYHQPELRDVGVGSPPRGGGN